MNLAVIITGLIVLAIFVVPFYYISHSKHHGSDEPDQQLQQNEKQNQQLLHTKVLGKKP